MDTQSNQIYQYMKTISIKFTLQDLKTDIGVNAQQIATKFGLLRNNASKILNELVEEDLLVKIKTRPVYFFDKQSLEEILEKKVSQNFFSFEDFQEIISEKRNLKQDPFQNIIGYNGSMKAQVEHAKAAIAYPPNGLNCLIIGETGVGKTLLAKVMYEYSIYTGKNTKDTPYITFNCADLSNNPQLLMSQLFGHMKGAFTGADKDRPGLIEHANGGILFLDEIHRLPAEGQEMLFQFIDTGEYSRLGETEKKRESKVMIIGATTETLESTFLKTFLRRIPVIIDIPNFEKRSTREKFEIAKHLLSIESNRIGKSLKIDRDILEALILNTNRGNIGQLKSDIQLICAQGFLKSLNIEDNQIHLTFDYLSSNIKKSFFLQDRAGKLKDIEKYIIGSIIIQPDGKILSIGKDDYESPYNLYKIIESKVSFLKKEGVSYNAIEKLIGSDINLHIRHNFNKFKNKDLPLIDIEKIVGEDILVFVNSIKLYIEEKINTSISDSFVYSLCLHICQLLKRIPNHKTLKREDNAKIEIDSSIEYLLAIEIKGMIEKKYNVILPEIEITYLKTLIHTIQDNNTKDVGILVVTHGTVASAMVRVAQELMVTSQIDYIDIPLAEMPIDTYPKIVNKTKQLDKGKGVLLLVDMGLLCKSEAIIQEETNVKVKTVDMVSTPLLLEAVSKAHYLKLNLEGVYNSLMKFKGYSPFMNYSTDEEAEKVIVTVCSTGEGAAEKLKSLVADLIQNIVHSHIKIIPLGLKNIEEKLKTLKNKYKIIATIGVTNIDNSIPFISIESLIQGRGELLLKEVCLSESYEVFEIEDEKQENLVLENLIVETLNKFLIFLNPQKIVESLLNFSKCIEDELKIKLSHSNKIMILIHVGCALERIVMHEEITETGYFEDVSINYVEAVKKASEIFKNALNLQICQNEIYTIAGLIRDLKFD